MIFGNFSRVFDYDQTVEQALNENFNQITSTYKKPTKISKLLTSLSNYGMNYDDKVYSNMVAVPADKLLQSQADKSYIEPSLFGNVMNNWKIKPEEDKPFSEKTLNQKIDILRKLSTAPELEDILDIMANESIVYDDDFSYICQPYIDTATTQDLNEQSSQEIRNCVDTAFYKIYSLVEWKTKAWDMYKRYLVDGVLSFEIIYDDLSSPKMIIGIVAIDPSTLTKTVKDGITYWIQYKGVVGRERVLLDSQIIYVKYEDSGVNSRQSYLERLIRPFNLYRIVEQAQVIWTVTQSSFKTLFTIPVAGMSKAKGMQTLAQAMNRYKEDISFNVDTGELQVNGKVNMPFNKEYWLPENENGRPEIETLVDNGPQLNDSDQIRYFKNNLYKMSKVPQNRFDNENQTTWFGNDPTQALRDEIDFSRFINRLRNNFSEIILKPLRIQLSLSIPDIKNDKRILNAISLRYNSYNLFEEMMNIEIMTKRIEFISSMKDSITITDSEGNEESYFSPRFLITKYLKMSDADLELNAKFKEEDKMQGKEANVEDEESEDMEMGGNEEPEETNEPEEEDNGGEIDQEMLGDVQPESPETAQA